MAGLDQRRGAKIDIDAGENADGSDQSRTDKADSDNL
jgi:hypothetical protein